MLYLQFISIVIASFCTIRVYCTVRTIVLRGSGVNAHRRERRVRTQATLYLLSYMNTFLWPIIAGGTSVSQQKKHASSYLDGSLN